MSVEDLGVAMQRMLDAEDKLERRIALGQLVERLVRASGQPADRLGMVAAVVMLLWDRSADGEDTLQAARQGAKSLLETVKPDVAELSRLAAVGRVLLDVAVELQGDQLVAEAAAKEAAEYRPEEGDWVIWLGKHIALVERVECAEVTTGDAGPIEEIWQVWIKTAGQQTIPVSLRELELYRRDSEPPQGDHMPMGN